MKKGNYYIVWLLCVATLFTACRENNPDLFDEGANGAYFDYEYASDFDKTLNFSEHIVGNPDTVTVALKVKLLGYLLDEKRTLAVKTKDVEGYEPATVSIGNVVFANKEYEKDIEIKVKRPEAENKMYAVCIYLDGSGDIGTGIDGKNEINLYVTETYEKPAVWYSHVETYLGSWSRETHIFLAGHTGNNYFYSNLYDNNLGMHLFDSIVALNVSAVNALLSNEPDEPVAVELPILKESDYPNYSEPYFWKDYEDILGPFRAGKFCRFSSALGDVNTKNVAEMFASDVGIQKMKDEAEGLHKADVTYMLNEYYRYASMGYSISEYQNIFWVGIKNNVNYDVRIPFWWEDPSGLGTAEVVKRYFGEYSAEKYQFMLKEIMKSDGAENFVAASILPFIYNRDSNSYGWDSTPFGIAQLAGEERLKECYRIVKAANDKLPSSLKFDIPQVELD